MDVLRLRLIDHGLSVDVAPALRDLNPIYDAAWMTIIGPYSLAITMGRMAEERAQQLEAELYADAVIVGSPDEPYTGWDEAQWKRWLLQHHDAFVVIRSLCESRKNWDPGNRVPTRVEQPPPMQEMARDGDDATAGGPAGSDRGSSKPVRD